MYLWKWQLSSLPLNTSNGFSRLAGPSDEFDMDTEFYNDAKNEKYYRLWENCSGCISSLH